MSMAEQFYCSEKINQLKIHRSHKKKLVMRRGIEFKKSKEKF